MREKSPTFFRKAMVSLPLPGAGLDILVTKTIEEQLAAFCGAPV